jgi:phosphoglycerate dehydrogenase-like enzyme
MSDGHFRVGVTRDTLRSDGSFVFAPASLSALDGAGIEWELIAEDARELPAELLRDYDALFHFSPVVSAASLAGVERLALIARHGVGLDFIDLPACTERGIAVTITPDAIRGPMASAAVALVLALAHRLVERDTAFHEGRWHEGRFGVVGTGLQGRTLGVVGFGNIGREVVRLLRPFEMRAVVATPRLSDEDAAELGVTRVELDALLRESDFVVLACPLKPETHHLLDAGRLALMKETACLVNIARGPIVDQNALVEALRSGRIAGAGLDVFEREPVDPDDPLLGLANVVAAPHSLGYTDQLFEGCVASACGAILAVAGGEVPGSLANPEVLENPSFHDQLRRFEARR